MKRKKLPNLSSLKKKADTLFSTYIRTKAADHGGIVQCYTCPNEYPIKQIQNGHFVSRTHLSTRWLEENCRPQCMACNVWRRGHYDVFSRNLVKEMGVDILDELNRLKNETKQMKRNDYNELIENLKEKIKDLTL